MVHFKLLVCKGWISEEAPDRLQCGRGDLTVLLFTEELSETSFLSGNTCKNPVRFLYSVTRNLSTAQCENTVFAVH